MKKIKVKFLSVAITYGFAYGKGMEAELEPSDNLALAIGRGRAEIIGDCPSDFKKQIKQIEKQYVSDLITEGGKKSSSLLTRN